MDKNSKCHALYVLRYQLVVVVVVVGSRRIVEIAVILPLDIV